MTNNKVNSLLFYLVTFGYRPFQVIADCLVGDIMYRPGDSIGQIGYQCLDSIDSSTYAGTTSICGDYGNIITTEVNLTCSGTVPYCVQCGPSGWGAALCLSSPDVPSSCPEPSSSGSRSDCRVGDIMYSTGASIGVIGYECLDESTYVGTASSCGEYGGVIESQVNLRCPQSVPYCVQCNNPSRGAALCLSNPRTPSHCSIGGRTDITTTETVTVTRPTSDANNLPGNVLMRPTDTSEGKNEEEEIDATTSGGKDSGGKDSGGKNGAELNNLEIDPTASNGGKDIEPDDEEVVATVGAGCLVGDVMYMPNQEIGQIGIECLDDGNEFRGLKSSCGRDGTVVDMEVNLSCPSSVPYCVQCGSPKRGAALCLEKPDVPSHCSDESHSSYTARPGTCHFGNNNYRPGDFIEQIGYECLDSSLYIGMTTTCGDYGNIITSEANLTCSGITPSCVQCGSPGKGAALCLTTPQVPDECTTADDNDVQMISPSEGCRVGDTMYRPGDSTGVIGYNCLDQNTYIGSSSSCGNYGNMITSEVNLTCPESAPYCIQCGPPGIGAALCLPEPKLPSNCPTLPTDSTNKDESDKTTGTGKSDKYGEGCMVDEKKYNSGGRISLFGSKCINSTHFHAKKIFCSNGRVEEEETIEICDNSAPKCIECPSTNNIGSIAVLCSSVPLNSFPEDCSYIPSDMDKKVEISSDGDEDEDEDSGKNSTDQKQKTGDNLQDQDPVVSSAHYNSKLIEWALLPFLFYAYLVIYFVL